MTKLIADMSMSLDGKIAAPDDDISRLVRWFFAGDTEVGPFRVSKASAELLTDAFESVGALIGGRRYFDLAQGWNGRHPMGVPVYILTHEPPADRPADSSIRFVTDGVESAVEQARAAAGGMDVGIATPGVVRQCLDAGLLDELQWRTEGAPPRAPDDHAAGRDRSIAAGGTVGGMTPRVAGIAGALAIVAGCGQDPAPRPAAVDREPTAFTPAGKPQPERPRGRWPTARVLAPVTLRATPGGRRLERLRPRTEFGSPKVLSVLRRRGGWLEVLAPERPNHRPAWIPASRARLGVVDVSIHVDRSRRVLVVRRGGRVLRRMPVAVGRPGTPTPTGRFAVTDKLRTGRPDSPYGCCALALSGHQTKLLPGWPGGDRLAIHATPQPGTIGRAASLGCLRAPTRHLRAMMRGVPLGAPVFVRA